MGQHLIFYDGECGLCDRCVQWLLRVDKTKQFVFAPLQGETASRFLKDLPADQRGIDSLVLIENFKGPDRTTYIQSKAIFRICWVLGGFYALIGWKCFLPAWLFDWAYRLVARNRHRLFSPISCVVPNASQKERFLP